MKLTIPLLITAMVVMTWTAGQYRDEAKRLRDAYEAEAKLTESLNEMVGEYREACTEK